MLPSVRSGLNNEEPEGGSETFNLSILVESISQAAAKIKGETNANEELEAQYYAVDKELHDLEEELDALILSAHFLREERTKTTRGHLKYSTNEATELDNEKQFIKKYLLLIADGKVIDDQIKKLKEEIAASRFECSVILSQIRPRSDKLLQMLRERKASDSVRAKRRAIDREDTEDDTDMENRLADFAGAAGAFGGGITYSTTFGAARGRLDIISWAFACFLWVMIDWAALKILATLPRRRELNGRIASVIRLTYPGYGGSIAAKMIEQRSSFITILTMGIAIPLGAGFILLGISVATLNSQARIPDPGSPTAIKAAGYYIVALLGNVIISFTAYPALRRLNQFQRFLPGLNELRNSGSSPSLFKES